LESWQFGHFRVVASELFRLLRTFFRIDAAQVERLANQSYFPAMPNKGASSRRSCGDNRSHPTSCALFTTASLHGSKDALDILNQICTPASILFDPKVTSRQRPSPSPPFRTFPPSPALARAFFSVPSTISVRNLDDTEPPVEMDKRHPSSFQQLEKLGEGTYATVSTPLCGARTGDIVVLQLGLYHIISVPCSWHTSITLAFKADL
jgi:hypothetical protein